MLTWATYDLLYSMINYLLFNGRQKSIFTNISWWPFHKIRTIWRKNTMLRCTYLNIYNRKLKCSYFLVNLSHNSLIIKKLNTQKIHKNIFFFFTITSAVKMQQNFERIFNSTWGSYSATPEKVIRTRYFFSPPQNNIQNCQFLHFPRAEMERTFNFARISYEMHYIVRMKSWSKNKKHKLSVKKVKAERK